MSEMSVEDFVARFEKLNLPVVIQGKYSDKQGALKIGKLTSIGHLSTSIKSSNKSNLKSVKTMTVINCECH